MKKTKKTKKIKKVAPKKTAPKTRKKATGTGNKIISLGGVVDFILGD